jgi:sec-independent protein translocase protein TatA
MGAGLLNPTHMVFLAILALLLFGAKRLPEVGRSLGTGLREFKTTVSATEGLTGHVRDAGALDNVPDPAAAADQEHSL